MEQQKQNTKEFKEKETALGFKRELNGQSHVKNTSFDDLAASLSRAYFKIIQFSNIAVYVRVRVVYKLLPGFWENENLKT